MLHGVETREYNSYCKPRCLEPCRSKRKSKIGIMQRFQDSFIVNNKITMHTTIRTPKGTDSLTKYATHIREFKILKKYLDKLRKRYKNFSLIRFNEWHFNNSLSIELYYDSDDFHHYSHYNWPSCTNAVFRDEEDCIYDKWLQSSYNIFNAPGHHSIASKGSKEKLKQILKKNVIPIKELVERIGDLSKLTLEQKNYFS